MIKRIKSSEIKANYDENKDLIEFLKEQAGEKLGGNCLIIVYKYNQVYIASIRDGNLNILGNSQFNLEFIIELRMFSEKGELHLWKYGDKFKWRLRKDN